MDAKLRACKLQIYKRCVMPLRLACQAMHRVSRQHGAGGKLPNHQVGQRHRSTCMKQCRAELCGERLGQRHVTADAADARCAFLRNLQRLLDEKEVRSSAMHILALRS